MFQDEDEFNLIAAMDCTGTPCVSEGSYKDERNDTVSFRMEGDLLKISGDLEIIPGTIMWYQPSGASVCLVTGSNLQDKSLIDMSDRNSVECY